MRFCVLEWICGGGMHPFSPKEISASLRQEGWQMLQCLCQQFHHAGHVVSTVVDQRLLNRQQMAEIANGAHLITGFQSQALTKGNSLLPLSALDLTLSAWHLVAQKCDQTIVVAPELDGILEYCINHLRKLDVPMLNCTGQFLANSCDKWLTAQCLHQHRIPHPLTWTVDDFIEADLDLADRWCVKPRWGAGCEGLRIFDAKLAPAVLSELRTPSNYIIQPWTPGRAYSCSAVVNRAGNITWLPLVTQEFSASYSSERFEGLCYSGARIAPPKLQQLRPTKLLNQALMALASADSREMQGWIGVDLVVDACGCWNVIEINPRLTTSAVELCSLGYVQLAEQMLVESL